MRRGSKAASRSCRRYTLISDGSSSGISRRRKRTATAVPGYVADDGASVVARDEVTYGGGYDLWLAIVERWFTSHGHMLSGFVRFYGEEPWDRGIFTVDGRLILTRL